MTDTPPEPPDPSAPPPPAPAPASTPDALQWPRWTPIAVAVAAAIALVVAIVAMRGFSNDAQDDAFTVQPYAPQVELITAREGVMAHEQPDANSPAVVMFGEGVTLNVTGRVSRGLGGEWYVVTWNERTAYVRQQDAVAGSGAPPAPEVREEEEPEEDLEEEKEKTPADDPGEDLDVFEPPPTASYGLSISDVNWVREPSARDFARYYPENALENGISGRVTLDCLIAQNGRLDCSVVHETPGGHGFGRAAMSISRQVRVHPRLPDGGSAAGRRLELPLAFRAG